MYVVYYEVFFWFLRKFKFRYFCLYVLDNLLIVWLFVNKLKINLFLYLFVNVWKLKLFNFNLLGLIKYLEINEIVNKNICLE